MAAEKKKKVKDPFEGMTSEELFQKALQNLQYAEQMEDPGLKISFFDRSDMIFARASADQTYAEEAEARRAEIRGKRNEALALLYLEKYKKACLVEAEAKNEDAWQQAADLFQTLKDEVQSKPVRQEILSAELQEKLQTLEQADAHLQHCRTYLQAKNRGRRRKRLIGFAVVAVILVGGLLFLQTAASRTFIASALDLTGNKTMAASFHQKAWWKSGSDADLDRYLSYAYEQGQKELEAGHPETACELLSRAAEHDYADSGKLLAGAEALEIGEAEIGEKVEFADKKWFVLARDGEKTLLLMSGYLEDVVLPAEDTYSWEDSAARSYLNSTYLQDAFLPGEADRICLTELGNEGNQKYDTADDENTEDQVFLLSEAEFLQYCGELEESKHMWWLRTPGAHEDAAAYINRGNTLMSYGSATDTDDILLRPAIWVDTAK